jgi:diguanylate cyclase (GGDEF)-like protein
MRAKKPGNNGFAVAALHPDGLKLITDSLGHDHGEELMRLLSERLATSIRPGDMVARVGDEGFMILVDHIEGLLHATHLAERLREAFSEPFELDGREIFSTASIGIALSYGMYEHAEEMLRDSQVAKHRAVARGGDRCEFFDKGTHARAFSLPDPLTPTTSKGF